jgi:hypothetical protein
MESSAAGYERPKCMCPEGAPARYASFRSVRDKRRTIPVNADGYWELAPVQ